MRERDTYNFSKIHFYIVQPDSWLSKKQLTLTFTNYCCNCLKDVQNKRKRKQQLKSNEFGIPWKCIFEAKATRKERKNHQNFPFKLNRQQQQQQQRHHLHNYHHYHHNHSTSSSNLPQSKYKIRSFSGFPRLFSNHNNSTILVLNFISHLLTLLLMVLLLLTQKTPTTTAATTTIINPTIPSRNPDWVLKYLNDQNSSSSHIGEEAITQVVATTTTRTTEEEDAVRRPIRNFTKPLTEEELLQFVKDGLGMQKLPDMTRVNVSQEEYESKYNEYLRRQYKRKRRDVIYSTILQKPWSNFKNFGAGHNIESPELNFYTFRSKPLTHSSQENESRAFRNEKYKSLRTQNNELVYNNHKNNNKRIRKSINNNKNKKKMFLHFTLKKHEISVIESSDIEEANLRLILVYKRKRKPRSRHMCRDGNHKATGAKKHDELLLKIYEKLPQKKHGLLLDTQKIGGIDDTSTINETKSQWLEFDVTESIRSMLLRASNATANLQNLKFEVHCENCKKFGYSTRILNGDEYSSESDVFDADNTYKMTPVLNIITRTRNNQAIDAQINDVKKNGERDDQMLFPGSCPASTDSNKKHPRCCRHVMHVTFKEIKGFEFIIQPKTFDAGFCFGRCPPRFNPAHHHAMLQSLVWKQYEGSKAPRPCCAPSKLVELEVLHVDEEDSQKLKVSTWTDMRVVECACS